MYSCLVSGSSKPPCALTFECDLPVHLPINMYAFWAPPKVPSLPIQQVSHRDRRGFLKVGTLAAGFKPQEPNKNTNQLRERSPSSRGSFGEKPRPATTSSAPSTTVFRRPKRWRQRSKPQICTWISRVPCPELLVKVVTKGNLTSSKWGWPLVGNTGGFFPLAQHPSKTCLGTFTFKVGTSHRWVQFYDKNNAPI